MPYTDWTQSHAGSAEVLFTGMFDEPAGTIARTVPRANCSANTIATAGSGLPNVRILPLPAGLTIHNISVNTGTTAEATGTHFWCAIMDANSNVIAVTADQTGAAYAAASTFLTNPVTVPAVIPQTGYYYAVVCVSAATVPTFAGGAALQAGTNAVPPVAAGQLATQAAPPLVGQNLGAVTNGAFNCAFWIS